MMFPSLSLVVGRVLARKSGARVRGRASTEVLEARCLLSGEMGSDEVPSTEFPVPSGGQDSVPSSGQVEDSMPTGMGDDSLTAGMPDDSVPIAAGDDSLTGGMPDDSVPIAASDDSLAGGGGEGTDIAWSSWFGDLSTDADVGEGYVYESDPNEEPFDLAAYELRTGLTNMRDYFARKELFAREAAGEIVSWDTTRPNDSPDGSADGQSGTTIDVGSQVTVTAPPTDPIIAGDGSSVSDVSTPTVEDDPNLDPESSDSSPIPNMNVPTVGGNSSSDPIIAAAPMPMVPVNNGSVVPPTEPIVIVAETSSAAPNTDTTVMTSDAAVTSSSPSDATLAVVTTATSDFAGVLSGVNSAISTSMNSGELTTADSSTALASTASTSTSSLLADQQMGTTESATATTNTGSTTDSVSSSASADTLFVESPNSTSVVDQLLFDGDSLQGGSAADPVLGGDAQLYVGAEGAVLLA